ncbi:hypothetical protein GQ457_06G007880 [Hibiscus cannabinus]
MKYFITLLHWKYASPSKSGGHEIERPSSNLAIFLERWTLSKDLYSRMLVLRRRRGSDTNCWDGCTLELITETVKWVAIELPNELAKNRKMMDKMHKNFRVNEQFKYKDKFLSYGCFSLHKSCSDAFGTGTRVSVSVRVLQKLAVVIFASGIHFLETLVSVRESGYRYGPPENTILAL